MKVWAITASRLSDGAPVYLRSDRRWTDKLWDAWTAEEKSAAAELLPWASEQEAVVCDPYVFGAGIVGGELIPASKREQIRADGGLLTLARLGYPALLPDELRQRKAG